MRPPSHTATEGRGTRSQLELWAAGRSREGRGTRVRETPGGAGTPEPFRRRILSDDQSGPWAAPRNHRTFLAAPPLLRDIFAVLVYSPGGTTAAMSATRSDLEVMQELVGVVPVDDNRARAQTGAPRAGRGGLFGGQVVAECLSACAHTVPLDAVPDSMHVNLLSGGRAGDVVDFSIERVRDGRAMQHREVRGYQGEELIVEATVVAARPVEGLDWQRASCPPVGPPDESPDRPDPWATHLGQGVFKVAHPQSMGRRAPTITPPVGPCRGPASRGPLAAWGCSGLLVGLRDELRRSGHPQLPRPRTRVQPQRHTFHLVPPPDLDPRLAPLRCPRQFDFWQSRLRPSIPVHSYRATIRFDLQGVLICRPAPIVTEAVASPADVTDSTGRAVKEP